MTISDDLYSQGTGVIDYYAPTDDKCSQVAGGDVFLDWAI